MEYVPVSVNLDCVHNANHHSYDQFPQLLESSIVIRVDKQGIPEAKSRKTGNVIPLTRISDKKIYLVSKYTALKLGNLIPCVFTQRRHQTLYSYHPETVEAIQKPTERDSERLARMKAKLGNQAF